MWPSFRDAVLQGVERPAVPPRRASLPGDTRGPGPQESQSRQRKRDVMDDSGPRLSSDPRTCRRALREIGEIAAVAVLPDSQMTDQEALQTIAAVAEWVRREAPGAGVPCGDVIRGLNEMTASVDFESLGDREALELFGEVLAALTTSQASIVGDSQDSAIS